ncbi:MAG TPA: LysR substrate-binding domain-containing protein [Bryobacteraceae bacterium]|jgi:DNA-binding transcriptional LysR family regulator|nr:LysR substrate-binding domain-containing protein [Bryobacteraceae bacterium]
MRSVLNATNVRVFESLARLQSVTRAADELGTSQPYVSKQIAVLEQQLAVPLFVRKGRRLYLTHAGEMLNQQAGAAMEALRVAEEKLLWFASDTNGKLRIATTTVGMYMLPKWLANFELQTETVDTTIAVMSCDDVERQIISGEADMGLTPRRPRSRSVTTTVVAEDSLVLAAQRDHPLAARPSIRLEDLKNEQFIVREPQSSSRALTEKRFFRNNPELRLRLQINQIEAVKESIKQGLGISFVSRTAIHNELQAGTFVAIPVAGVDLRRPICILRSSNKVRSKAGARLAEHISATNPGAQIR